MIKTPMVIWVASTNPHKIEELQVILRLLKLEQEMVFKIPDNLLDVPETGLTFLDNARIKAESFAAQVRRTNPAFKDYILAEDSGLIVPSLSGSYGYAPFPGVFSNRWMTPDIRADLLSIPVDSQNKSQNISDNDKNSGILALLNQQALTNKNVSRDAAYVCAMSLWDGHEEIATGYGEMPLQVAAKTLETEKKQNTSAFGYDPIMLSVPSLRCVGQMSIEEKSSLSHRAAAFRQLMALTKRGPAHN